MGTLRIQNLSVAYGKQTVVQDFNLTVNNGEIVSVLGPSGVGKTTLLKTIAGLLSPYRGNLVLNDKDITSVPAEKRSVVLMFQQPLLFPHMTVAQNVAFGLRVRGRLQASDHQRVAEMLERVQLAGLEHRKPHQLSGGQQQRVALARALVLEPAVLLLDEPLSSLDASLRQEMRDLLQSLQNVTGTTMLFITHDQSEALMLSHRIALLLDGGIRQIGTPHELVYRPVDFHVAEFFGNHNRIVGNVDQGIFESPVGSFKVPANFENTGPAVATIRPEHIQRAPDSKGIPATVVSLQFEGHSTRAQMEIGPHIFNWLTLDVDLQPGQTIRVQFPPEYIWFPPHEQRGVMS